MDVTQAHRESMAEEKNQCDMKDKKRYKRKNKEWIRNGITKRLFNEYVWVRIDTRWIAEHRLVVEDKIGRLLNSDEVVHHLDENKKNNSINNLMLFPNQKAHQRFHLKLKQFGMTEPLRKQIENRWKEFK